MAGSLIAAEPVTGRGRIQSLDILRGFALFGILLMNITGFGLPQAYSDPTVYGGSEGINLWAWGIATMLFEGTQRGIFSILFGAGFILMTSRLEAAGHAPRVDEVVNARGFSHRVREGRRLAQPRKVATAHSGVGHLCTIER